MVVNLNIFSSYLVEGETEDETDGGVTSPARPVAPQRAIPAEEEDGRQPLFAVPDDTNVQNPVYVLQASAPAAPTVPSIAPLPVGIAIETTAVAQPPPVFQPQLQVESESAHPTVGISEDANFGQVVAAAAPVLQPTADPTAALGGPSAATCVERTHGRRSVFHL